MSAQVQTRPCRDCGQAPRYGRASYCHECKKKRGLAAQKTRRERLKAEPAAPCTYCNQNPRAPGQACCKDCRNKATYGNTDGASWLKAHIEQRGHRALAAGEAMDRLIAARIFGEEVPATWLVPSRTRGMVSPEAVDALPGKRHQVPCYSTSTTAMWLLFRRIRELGWQEPYCAWLSLELYNACQTRGAEWRGEIHELLFGGAPAPYTACVVALDLADELTPTSATQIT